MIKTRDILLNFNFFWESENLNINPVGWVILESKLNGLDATDSNNFPNGYLKLNCSETSAVGDTIEWEIPELFKQVFKYGNLPKSNYINFDFTLNYNPEKFNGTYSQFRIKYSEEAILKETLNINPFGDISIKELLSKNLDLKPYFNSTTKQYEDSKYSFKYNNNNSLLYDESYSFNINSGIFTDQVMVLIFNTSIQYNTTKKIRVPLRYQESTENGKKKVSPLIWEYKIAPIMPYGVLSALAVEGAIDLLLIGEYLQDLNTFKYYNTAYQSSIKIGMTSYNSLSKNLDRLRLSFYDIHGLACTYTLPKMTSYNGTFLITVPLDGVLHEGMEANKKYPNVFSDSILEGMDDKRIIDKTLIVPATHKFIDSLEYLSGTRKPLFGETLLYAYHDETLPEGLIPNYLYFVKVEYNLEEDPEYKVLQNENKEDYGFWFWTNNKFNDYYFDSKISNYNDLPFDLDLKVSATIRGNAPKTSTDKSSFDDNDSATTIYYENNEDNPYEVLIYPDLLNNYQTLFFNSLDVKTFIKSIDYTINKEKGTWDRSATTIGIDDTDLDSPEHSYVNWTTTYDPNNIKCKESSTSNLLYYPTFGIVDNPISTEATRLILQKDVDSKNLILNLFLDIKRTMKYKMVKVEKDVQIYRVQKMDWDEKWATSTFSGKRMNRYPYPTSGLYITNTASQLEQVVDSFYPDNLDVDEGLYLALSRNGKDNSVASTGYYYVSKGGKEHWYNADSISNGGTEVSDSLFKFPGQLGTLCCKGWAGTIKECHIDSKWRYVSDATTWNQGRNFFEYSRYSPSSGKDRYDDINYAYKPVSVYHSYYRYKYNKDVYLITDKSALKYPYLGYPIYCIDDSSTFKAKRSVPDNILLNENYIKNQQDLIIQLNPVEFPEIYLKLVNLLLWKNIPEITNDKLKNSSCIKPTFLDSLNNIKSALTVILLASNIKYLTRDITTVEFFDDPDLGIQALDGYNRIYYKPFNTIEFIENADFIEKLVVLYDIINGTFTKDDNGDLYISFVWKKYSDDINSSDGLSSWKYSNTTNTSHFIGFLLIGAMTLK